MLVGVGPDSTPLASQGPPPLAGHRPPCPERGLRTWDGDPGPALPLPKTLGAVTPRGFCRGGRSSGHTAARVRAVRTLLSGLPFQTAAQPGRHSVLCAYEAFVRKLPCDLQTPHPAGDSPQPPSSLSVPSRPSVPPAFEVHRSPAPDFRPPDFPDPALSPRQPSSAGAPPVQSLYPSLRTAGRLLGSPVPQLSPPPSGGPSSAPDLWRLGQCPPCPGLLAREVADDNSHRINIAGIVFL